MSLPRKVNIEQIDGRVKFTFNDNFTYLQNGEISYPLNSLSMIIDESNMVTFKNMAGDIVHSISLTDLARTKAEMEELYADVFVGGGVDLSAYYTAAETDQAIEDALDDIDLSAYYTKTETDTLLNGKVSTAVTASLQSQIDTKEETISRALNQLETNKLDASAYTPTDLSAYYTAAETDQAIADALDDIDLTDYYTSAEVDAALQDIEDEIAEAAQVTSRALFDLHENKLDASAYTVPDLSVYVTQTALDTRLDGLTLVRITQADYDQLVLDDDVDEDTLYIISNPITA